MRCMVQKEKNDVRMMAGHIVLGQTKACRSGRLQPQGLPSPPLPIGIPRNTGVPTAKGGGAALPL
jgi:hypothetical protein